MAVITEDLLLRQSWRFGRSDGSIIQPCLTFLPDGSLRPSGAAEARWAIKDGVMVLYTETGEESTRFARTHRTVGGGCRMTGRFLLNIDAFSYHFLDSLDTEPPLKESRLNLSMSLTRESDVLLVTFNSAGRPVEGPDTHWEFYRLPDEFGLDSIRIAEARSPAMFYLDKTRLLRGIIGSAVAQGYKQVVSVGISSGGYIAMLMAELMCGDHPDVDFFTFVINPQAAHAESHRHFVTRYTRFGWTPLLLTDQAMSLRDVEATDLAVLMTTKQKWRGNVHHAVYYDAGNLAEAYHASLIGSQPGVSLYPQELEMPHHLGAAAIYEKRLVHDAVGALVSRRSNDAS